MGLTGRDCSRPPSLAWHSASYGDITTTRHRQTKQHLDTMTGQLECWIITLIGLLDFSTHALPRANMVFFQSISQSIFMRRVWLTRRINLAMIRQLDKMNHQSQYYPRQDSVAVRSLHCPERVAYMSVPHLHFAPLAFRIRHKLLPCMPSNFLVKLPYCVFCL